MPPVRPSLLYSQQPSGDAAFLKIDGADSGIRGGATQRGQSIGCERGRAGFTFRPEKSGRKQAGPEIWSAHHIEPLKQAAEHSPIPNEGSGYRPQADLFDAIAQCFKYL